jgi:hypothetical protein
VDQQFATRNAGKLECVTQFPYSLTAAGYTGILAQVIRNTR